jgi:thiol-disulfide isomerase/thioredoxin
MKNVTRVSIFLSLLMVLGFTTDLRAQDGIQFFHGTFAEAQAKAKRENKLIFMDAYTSWCGPCKWMSANVFTDPSVAEYYNAHFVNVKMDMERGEGPDLGRRFSIMAYPTLLFIDNTGAVKSRAMGAKPAADFIALGQKVVKGN